MTMSKQAIVFIYITGQPVPAGMLTTFVDGRYTSSEFAYGSRYIERPDAIPVDPVTLPLPPPGLKDAVHRALRQDISCPGGIYPICPDRHHGYH